MKISRWFISAVCLVSTCTLASAQAKNYLILANSQGKGSTAFASKINGVVTANIEKYGVVLVSSSDPAFINKTSKLGGVQQVSADPNSSSSTTNRRYSSATISRLPFPPITKATTPISGTCE